MCVNLYKLKDKPWDNKQAVNNREQFIEMIFRSNCHQYEYKFDCEQIDEDGINYFVYLIFCEEVESSHDEGQQYADGIC